MGTLTVLAVLLYAVAVKADYIFTFPKSLESEKPTRFCLSGNDIDIEDWVSGQKYEVQIELVLVHTTPEKQTKFNYNIAIRDITTAEFSFCPEFNAPQYIGKYVANVTASVVYDNRVQDLFKDSAEVSVTKPDYITLIQTDKPLYKPGQVVKFRAMTMDYQLMAKTFGFSLITIEDPSGRTLKQWRDVVTQNGLVGLEMALGEEPPLGVWKIKAVFDEGSSEATFKVDEYVLPKFEVVVTPPTYLLPTTQTINGKVCAKYTFGKPVVGNLMLSVCMEEPQYLYNMKTRPCSRVIAKIDGCYEFFIDAEDINLKSKKHAYWNDLKIVANVTDEATGITLSGESTGPRISQEVINLNLEDDSDKLYKPGFPYRGRVIAKNPDGSPAVGEEIEVTATSGYTWYLWRPWVGLRPDAENKEYKWTKNFTSDSNGVVNFVITDVDPTIGFLSLNARAVHYDDRYTFNYDYLTTYRPSAYSSITRWHSASNSYIYIKDIDEAPACGTDMEVDVFYTTPRESTYKFQTMVKAGDRVVYTKNQMVTFDGISNFDIIAIKPEQLLEKMLVPPPPPPPEIDPPEVEVAEVGEEEAKERLIRPKTLEAEPVVEDLIVPEVAKLLGNEEMNGEAQPPIGEEERLIGRFKVRIPITADMSPDAQLLVYYMRDDGEVIATSIKFNIEKCFKNKVAMQFEKDTYYPGDNVNFEIKASPESTCFVGMVDKSINLLGGQNQLTPSQVFEKVRSVARPPTWVSYWRKDNDYCDKKYPEKSFGEYSVTYLTSIGVDAVKSFRDFNTWIVTDGLVETRPCKEEHRMVYYSMPMPLSRNGMPGAAGIAVQEDRVMVSCQGNECADDADNAEALEDVAEPERIRSLFPETWLWDIYEIGQSGEATFVTVLPDTITEWIGNSLCTNPNDGVGLSKLTSVTGFQPFFVSLTLPYAAVRGENMSLPVTVYNYLDKTIRLDLQLDESEGFQISGKNGRRVQLCLGSGVSETVKFYVMPTVIGEVEFLVKAVSIDDNGACTNAIMDLEHLGVSDGVQRHLLVEAEGVPHEDTTSEYICLEGSTKKWSAPLLLPDNLVMDSERSFVSVVGDIMGPALSNLKNLLRMPYGCGEQNMASWAPNIYVLQYLTNTNQLTSKIEDEAKGYMGVGYRRQMKYRHSDNSYSAFGENNYNNASGSIWLTAFVVKSMAQSSMFITIDNDDITNSVDWILDHQLPSGCFPKVGKVFSSYMKGGLASGDNQAGLTAFIMTALLEPKVREVSSEEKYKMGIQKGFMCLGRYDARSLDTYTLSLMAYVYSMVRDDQRLQILRSELNNQRIQESGLVHWERENLPEEEDKGYYWRASSAEVEMTAYVAMAILSEGPPSVGPVQPIIQWLTRQRNSYGGFSSTQDTVVALQALALFGGFTFSGTSSLRMTLLGQDKELSVTPDNLLVYQTVGVDMQIGSVDINVTGNGCALVQVSTRYNTYEEPKQSAFKLKYDDFRSNRQPNKCGMRALHICAQYDLPRGSSDMAIVEVKMLTGWEPVTESIEDLEKNGIISRFEVDRNYVQLYFDEITSDETCIVIEVMKTFETTSKPAVIRVYDYYETAHSVSITYNLDTTCKVPTKEDIPKDNAGLDCSIMQCRVLDTPPLFVPKGCPVCKTALTEDELKTSVCESQRAFKATVGRRGKYLIKLMSNLTALPKSEIGAFVNPEMNERCDCQLLSAKDQKALFLTIPQTWESRNSPASPEEVIKLGRETMVIKLTKKVERMVNRIKGRKEFCNKLERRRRSKERKQRKLSRRRQKGKGRKQLRHHNT